MTKEQFAARLSGREYGSEITPEEEFMAQRDGLVVVFGASDDLVEFRGDINDELDAYNGTTVKLDGLGLLPRRESIEDDVELEKYFIRKRGNLKTIEALWCAEDGYSWTFKTDIPHATFEVMEDGEHYCRGIVFDLGALA